MNNSKVFGSTLIVAGTTIGAGMLALPLVSAGLGFGISSLIIVVMWALMAYTALLMVEVHQYAPREATLYTLANNLLGKKGQLVASFAMVFLFYALCAAYIAGGGEQLSENFSLISGTKLPSQYGSVVFTIIVAVVVSIGAKSVDMLNRALFSLKIVTLILMLVFLFPHVSLENLEAMPLEQGLLITALPVVFTSFGFHGSIPSIVRYIGTDAKTLRKIFVIGSAIPLVVYILWQITTQGILPQSEFIKSTGLSNFIGMLSTALKNPMISSAVTIFADLALATSFLGVSLGLFDFISDVFKKSESKGDKFLTALITFLPPLGFAIFYPQGFIAALGYASVALVVLALFLPVAMVYKQRKERSKDGYQVSGGKFGLLVVTLFGIAIIAAQFIEIFK